MSLEALGMRLADLDRAAELAVQNPYSNPGPVTRDWDSGIDCKKRHSKECAGMTGDLKRLQGTWTIVEVETDGAKSDGGGSKVALDGANFTTVAMGAEYSGTVALDAKKKPKTFDLLFTSGPHKGEKSLGIYELDGDTWRTCLALAGIKTRPKKFATAPGSGFALETLKRGDVAALAEPAAEPGASETSAAEWELLSASIDGAPLEAQFVKYGRRSVHGNLLTVRFGPQVFVKTQFTVDEIGNRIGSDSPLCEGRQPHTVGHLQAGGRDAHDMHGSQGAAAACRLHGVQGGQEESDGLEAG